jgi:hypothetical protein
MSCYIPHRFKDIGNNFRINRISACFGDKTLQITESIKMFRNGRCTVRETFRSSGTGTAQCGKHSEVPEQAPHSAGNIPKFRNRRYTVRETFRSSGTGAAQCGRLSETESSMKKLKNILLTHVTQSAIFFLSANFTN